MYVFTHGNHLPSSEDHAQLFKRLPLRLFSSKSFFYEQISRLPILAISSRTTFLFPEYPIISAHQDLVNPSVRVMPPTEQSTSSGAKKRKLAEPKFYAVRAGHSAGVYTDWNQCKAQITGFKGAAFKSFSTQADAQAFVEGRDVAVPSPDGTGRFYGVAVGLVPGVYTDWPNAQRQILGVKGPKYKRFSSKADAIEFVEANRKSVAVDSEDTTNVGKPISYETSGESGEPSLKSRMVDTEPKMAMRPKRAITNVFQSRSARSASDSTTLNVYTDGSSLGNGKRGASAGVGVYFGVGDGRNISERLQGLRQTNQRAELTAILRTLEVVSTSQNLQILTDSQYSINCVTKWCISWEKNGWKNAKKQDVENQDLIRDILSRIRERTRLGTSTDFTWVKGHSENPGNEAADMLAVAGSQRGGR